MAKITKEDAIKAVLALAAFFGIKAGSDEAEDNAEETVKVEIPKAKIIAKMKGAQKKELAKTLGIEDETDDEDRDTALTILSQLANEEEPEVEEADLKTACTALGLKASKDAEANAEALKKYVEELEVPAEGDAEAEDSAEEADAEDADTDDADADDAEAEEEDEPKSKKEKGKKKKDDDEEADADDADAEDDAEADEAGDSELSDEAKAAIAKAVKAVAPADQIKRLKAYNAAASEEIEFNAKKPGEGYATLLEKLVDAEGNLAKWGKPYIRTTDDGESGGYCCGLELEAVKVKVAKGEKAPQRGKCSVTGKEFDFDEDEGSFSEVASEE